MLFGKQQGMCLDFQVEIAVLMVTANVISSGYIAFWSTEVVLGGIGIPDSIMDVSLIMNDDHDVNYAYLRFV